jgi:signal transduction histidine kinase
MNGQGSAAAAADPGAWLRLDHVGGPLALLTLDGGLIYATPSARVLLARLQPDHEAARGHPPASLPPALWAELATAPVGQPVEWQPGDSTLHLGCTRYQVGDDQVLLLMRELSERSRALARRLHEQRLEATGRLVATIAHDLRAPLASIVFEADLLAARGAAEGDEVTRQSVQGVRAAAARLQRTIDGLLDFARLGPPVCVDVSLPDVLERVGGLLRPLLRERGDLLVADVHPEAAVTRGNPLVLEQVFVNLVMNAVEAAPDATWVQISSQPGPDGLVHVSVRDQGPGVPPTLRARIFEPFFSTKPRGTGLGLTLAREAVRGLGGELLLDESECGTCFVLRLPAGRRLPPGAAT